MAPTFLYTAKCATVGFISPSRLSLDSPEQAKQATGPRCLTLPSLGVCFQLFQCLVEVVAEAAVDARPEVERDFPGLLPLLTLPWRDVGCVVFAAVAKAYYESTKSSFFAEMFEGNEWLPSSGVTICGLFEDVPGLRTRVRTFVQQPRNA